MCDNLITKSKFNAMKSEFDNSIRVKLTTQETESVWWSIDNLRNYLDEIEEDGTNDGITVSGVRFYMVANTDTPAERLTLAIRPTSENDAGQKITVENGKILNKGLTN